MHKPAEHREDLTAKASHGGLPDRRQNRVRERRDRAQFDLQLVRQRPLFYHRRSRASSHRQEEEDQSVRCESGQMAFAGGKERSSQENVHVG